MKGKDKHEAWNVVGNRALEKLYVKTLLVNLVIVQKDATYSVYYISVGQLYIVE